MIFKSMYINISCHNNKHTQKKKRRPYVELFANRVENANSVCPRRQTAKRRRLSWRYDNSNITHTKKKHKDRWWYLKYTANWRCATATTREKTRTVHRQAEFFGRSTRSRVTPFRAVVRNVVQLATSARLEERKVFRYRVDRHWHRCRASDKRWHVFWLKSRFFFVVVNNARACVSFTCLTVTMRVIASVAIDGDFALVLRCTVKEFDRRRQRRATQQTQQRQKWHHREFKCTERGYFQLK